MTHFAPPRHSEIDVFAASCFELIAWLMRVATLLGAPKRSRRFARWVTKAEWVVEIILFLRAGADTGPILIQRRAGPPPSAPPGFRRGKVSMRLPLRVARVRARGADPLTRLARLVTVMAQPARYIARFAALFAQSPRPRAFIIVAPPAWRWRDAQARPPAFADSS